MMKEKDAELVPLEKETMSFRLETNPDWPRPFPVRKWAQGRTRQASTSVPLCRHGAWGVGQCASIEHRALLYLESNPLSS